MNILIIGNGFDVAHGLPTKYGEFLDICILARRTRATWEQGNLIKSTTKYANEKEHSIIKEFAEVLGEKNFNAFKKYANCYWVQHFQRKKSVIGVNWLNFEEEIKKVTEWLALEMNNSDEELFYTNTVSDEDLIAYCKSRQYDKKPIPYRELFLKLSEEQKKLVKALALYMDVYVGRSKVKKLPLFTKFKFDKLLSFNYTSTYEKNYNYDIEACYIHGKPGKNATDNNMVLGFDDHYIADKKVIPETIPFEKYYQRIILGTDINYFCWLDQMKKESENMIFIFGHSLAPADGDILRQFILNDNVKVKIYYYDEFDRGEKVKNLAIILGPDELIKKAGGLNPVIEFVQDLQ